MQISTRLCPSVSIVFIFTLALAKLDWNLLSQTRWETEYTFCEVTFTVLSRRVTTGTMCRACYTKRSCKRMTLVYIPAHLRFRFSPGNCPPQERFQRKTPRFSSSSRFISNSALPISASSRNRGEKKIGNFLKLLWKIREQRKLKKVKFESMNIFNYVKYSLKNKNKGISDKYCFNALKIIFSEKNTPLKEFPRCLDIRNYSFCSETVLEWKEREGRATR